MPKEAILTRTSLSDRQQAVLAAYVRRRLYQERTESARFSAANTRHWLTWLAGQMTSRNQTEFYLEQLRPDWLPTPSARRLYRVMVGLIVGLVNGLFFGLVVGLVVGLSFGPVNGLVVGLIFGLVFGQNFGLGVGPGAWLDRDQIKPAEAFSWSWSQATSMLAVGLGFGLVVGSGFGLIFGLVFALTIGLVVGLAFGLTGNALAHQQHLHPNEGIRRSFRNALFFGLVVGLFFGLVGGLVVGLGFGLGFGLFFGLRVGGLAVLQHCTLRFLLSRSGAMPLLYVRFLHEAAGRLLLRKTGSGYVFIHRLVQAYFANLGTPPRAVARVKP